MSNTNNSTEIQLLKAEIAKGLKREIMFSDIIHQHVIAMRAAVVAGHLEGLDHGMQWIFNTLAGPGHLPDLEEARTIGGAQAMFDAELREHEAFRAANPGPEPEIPYSRAAVDVLAERRRQVEAEGWTPEHDDEHTNDEIAALACFYAMPPESREWSCPDGYGDTLGESIRPAGWQTTTGDRRRELVKAGALILAEIERIDRAEAAKTQPQPSGD